jgi:hypothetical protein
MTESTRKIEAAAAPAPTNLWNVTVICILTWLIPGSGHLLMGRWKRGIAFLVCIPVLFFLGLGLGAKIWRYDPPQPLTFFAMVSQAGVGIPYFVGRSIASYEQSHSSDSALHRYADNFGYGEGNIRNVTFEYGNTFTWVAGLLNFLIILDAYDIAVGRKK